MAIRSMTGFGRGSAELGSVRFEAVVRGVNHRFLDLSVKILWPEPELEQEIQKLIRERFTRGRVEVSIQQSGRMSSERNLQIHVDLLRESATNLKNALHAAGLTDAAFFRDALGILFRREEFIDFSGSVSDDVPARHKVVLQAIEQALDAFSAMRLVEGEALERDLLDRVASLRRIVGGIEKAAEILPLELKRRLRDRIEKLLEGNPVDEERVVLEAAVLADRGDITEELTRLRSHLDQLQLALTDNQGGRKIEFLLQEVGREINTCGSKAQLAEISRLVVEAKAELERMREQVQNVE